MTDAGAQKTAPEAIRFVLETLQVGVNQLVETDTARRDEMQFLADLREKIVQALTMLHDQLASVHTDVMRVGKDVTILRTPPATQPQPKPWKQWRTYLPWGGGVVIGLALMGGVWMRWPATAREAFAIAINMTLRESHGRIPNAVQEKINMVYRQFNFTEPGQK